MWRTVQERKRKRAKNDDDINKIFFVDVTQIENHFN